MESCLALSPKSFQASHDLPWECSAASTQGVLNSLLHPTPSHSQLGSNQGKATINM